MNEDTRSDKPYKLGDGSYTTLAELAAALAENHELAGEHIERGYVQKWIEEDLRDYDARIALDKLLDLMPRYEVDWAGCKRVNMQNVAGYHHVPVKVVK